MILEPVLLTSLVALPALTATTLILIGLSLMVMGWSPLPSSVWRTTGLLASVLTFLAALHIAFVGFDLETIGLQAVEQYPWAPVFGISLGFGADGIGLCFLVSTAGLFPLAFLAARNEVETSTRAWVVCVLLLETTLLGGIASTNLLVFVSFWTASLVPILLWLGRWGERGRARAASRIWTTEMVGLAALIFVVLELREASVKQFGSPTLDLFSLEGAPALLDLRIELAQQPWLFLAFVLPLAIRLPVVPLHFWLPAAHAASPSGLSMVLATGFVQTAAIGWLRYALPLFPDAAVSAAPILAGLGIVGLGYASLVALVQKELKRLVAYASVGYAGFALVGVSTLNAQGLTGAVIQLLTHGLATAGLFLLIGFLAARRGTTEVAAFGGLAKPMPVCAFFFGVMVLSLMGLPLLGGFVGDLFVLLGSLETQRVISAFALIAMAVAASYLLWVQRRLFLGPVEEPANRGLIDLDRIERGVLLAVVIPIVAIGVYPNPVLRRVEPAVLELLYQMDRRSLVEEQAGVRSRERGWVASLGSRAIRPAGGGSPR